MEDLLRASITVPDHGKTHGILAVAGGTAWSWMPLWKHPPLNIPPPYPRMGRWDISFEISPNPTPQHHSSMWNLFSREGNTTRQRRCKPARDSIDISTEPQDSGMRLKPFRGKLKGYFPHPQTSFFPCNMAPTSRKRNWITRSLCAIAQT